MDFKKRAFVVAVAMVSALTPPFVSAQASHDDQSASNADQRTVVGVWRTVVTPNNCQTGVPFPSSLQGLFTFNEGGTMSEYGIAPGSSPALRSPGHGVWRREHGRQEYSLAFTYYRYDPSGLMIGSQKVTAGLRLGGNGDQIATKSFIEVHDVNDNVIAIGCGTAVGTRFE